MRRYSKNKKRLSVNILSASLLFL
ncbi:hypothetical protein CHELA41_22971 [Hyphomicrobiales bacterium]|nr:hypothetical protein CHELA41_22971 [Hyphomicrobiales bacterium]